MTKQPPTALSTSVRKLGACWAQYLDSLDWHHVVTLTTKAGLQADRLQDRIVHGYFRTLERVAQRRLDWFLVLEQSHGGQHHHAHALIAGTVDLAVDQMQGLWHLGFSRIAIFSPTGGAGGYLTKTLPEAPDSYRFSRRLPNPRYPPESTGFR